MTLSPNFARLRSRLSTTIAGCAAVSIALAACGGSDSGSSTPDIAAMLASTTSDELCDEVPSDAIQDIVGGGTMTTNPQIGSITCYLSFPSTAEVFITNEVSFAGGSGYSDVRAEEDGGFDSADDITGVGDEAVFYESDDRTQLTIGIGDKTLSVASVTFGGTPPLLDVDELRSIAAVLLGTTGDA